MQRDLQQRKRKKEKAPRRKQREEEREREEEEQRKTRETKRDRKRETDRERVRARAGPRETRRLIDVEDDNNMTVTRADVVILSRCSCSRKPPRLLPIIRSFVSLIMRHAALVVST